MRYGSLMSTITLKNVPENIHQALKSRAKAHGRSLNKEVICSLEQLLSGTPTDVGQYISEARAVREEMNVYITQRELTAIKNEGRS
jgi:plasmid stability protein